MKNSSKFHEADLDESLNSPAQRRVGEMVHSLPEDTVSLSWRSALNARLSAQAIRRHRLQVFAWVWKPAVGLGLACALAVPFVMQGGMTGTPSPDIERALVNNYVESSAARDAAVDGVTGNEARDVSAQPASFDLDQEDVGAVL